LILYFRVANIGKKCTFVKSLEKKIDFSSQSCGKNILTVNYLMNIIPIVQKNVFFSKKALAVFGKKRTFAAVLIIITLVVMIYGN
jgi:hypothetical protein